MKFQEIFLKFHKIELGIFEIWDECLWIDVTLNMFGLRLNRNCLVFCFSKFKIVQIKNFKRLSTQMSHRKIKSSSAYCPIFTQQNNVNSFKTFKYWKSFRKLPIGFLCIEKLFYWRSHFVCFILDVNSRHLLLIDQLNRSPGWRRSQFLELAVELENKSEEFNKKKYFRRFWKFY